MNNETGSFFDFFLDLSMRFAPAVLVFCVGMAFGALLITDVVVDFANDFDSRFICSEKVAQ